MVYKLTIIDFNYAIVSSFCLIFTTHRYYIICHNYLLKNLFVFARQADMLMVDCLYLL